MFGVIDTNDIFGDYFRYELTITPNKSEVHYCMDCYHRRVIDAANACVNRKKNEQGWLVKKRDYEVIFSQLLFAQYKKDKG